MTFFCGCNVFSDRVSLHFVVVLPVCGVHSAMFCVLQLHKLPVQSGIREAFVTHFMHLLQRRALTLIKHVEVET